MSESNQITVNELYAMCVSAIGKGYGKRKIIISDDVEGNGFHGLYFGFCTVRQLDLFDDSCIVDTETNNEDELLVLG